MNELYKKKLLTKNILVGADEKYENYKASNYLLYTKCNTIVTKGMEYITLDTVKFLSSALGIGTAYPYYRNFPKSVIEEDEFTLRVDQLCSYVFGLKHSIIEGETISRVPVDVKEAMDTKKQMVCITEIEAYKELKIIALKLLESTRPLNSDDIEFVRQLIFDCILDPADIKEIKGIKNAIRLLAETKDDYFIRFIHTSDVLKLVEVIECKLYGRHTPNKLRITGSNLRFVKHVLEATVDNPFRYDPDRCVSKRKTWVGLLNRMHVGPNSSSDKLLEFNETIRDKKFRSSMSVFEELMKTGPEEAVKYLVKQEGQTMVQRHIVYILSRLSDMELDVMKRILNIAFRDSNNAISMLQLYKSIHKLGVNNNSPRIFSFTKNELAKNHIETYEEMSKRKSYLSNTTRIYIQYAIYTYLQEKFDGCLGNVYIDGNIENITLPLSVEATNNSINSLPTGSRISIPEGRFLRVFNAWSKADDLDISLVAYFKNGEKKTVNWRSNTYDYKDMILFSGDETQGYEGGAEYFDLDLEKLLENDFKYLVLGSNVYSGDVFDNIESYGGFMIRNNMEVASLKLVDIGNHRRGTARRQYSKALYEEIYDIKTVCNRYKMSGSSRSNKILAVDVEKREVVWLNISESSQNRVVDENRSDWLLEYIEMASHLNMGTFVDIAGLNITDDINKADTIVTSDNNYDVSSLPDNTELIRPCDTDKILSVLNS